MNLPLLHQGLACDELTGSERDELGSAEETECDNAFNTYKFSFGESIGEKRFRANQKVQADFSDISEAGKSR